MNYPELKALDNPIYLTGVDVDIDLNQIIDNEEYWKEVGLELIESRIKKAIKEDLMHRKEAQR